MYKLFTRSRAPIDFPTCASLWLSVIPMMASIEKQNDQHSQHKEANRKMSHVAQVRTHEDRE